MPYFGLEHKENHYLKISMCGVVLTTFVFKAGRQSLIRGRTSTQDSKIIKEKGLRIITVGQCAPSRTYLGLPIIKQHSAVKIRSRKSVEIILLILKMCQK